MRAALVCLAFGCVSLWGEARFTDPHAFSNAAEMYRTAAVQPFDGTAAALLKTVGARLKAKLTLEDDRVWGSLVKLNPYRKTIEVQAAIEGWATFYAGEIASLPKKSSAANDPFDRANAAYKAGDFEKAAVDYRKFLLKALSHYDARNNLALAELHLGIDVAAEIELLTLRRLNDSYLPAAVNLTVVYERLGLGTKARELADQAATAGKDVPQAVFNAAWYKDVAGSPADALVLLKPLADGENVPASVKSYEALLQKVVTGNAMAFWNKGLAGSVGAYRHPAGMFVALAIFLVLSLIIVAIASRKRIGRNRGKKPGFWTFLLLVFVYLRFWGLPDTKWLLAMALYVIVMMTISRAKASAY
jgi:tetratricopeptide (TPR) repeat protein